MNRRRWLLPLVLLLAALAVPDSARHPATLSLVGLEGAKSVDFERGIVWVLALGSDARTGDVMEGNADAIELIGLDFAHGNAVAVAIPRDTWMRLPGDGLDRINAGLHEPDGPKVMARAVESLVGIAPDYVVTTGFDGFADLVDAVGGLRVHSDLAFDPPGGGAPVVAGMNSFDGSEAVEFARARVVLPRSDFDRMANHQELLLGILRRLRESEDQEGFLEEGTWTALSALDTNLSPLELYRLAQAVTTLEPRRVTRCVLPATPDVEFGADILYVDLARAHAIGDDVRTDARLDGPC